MIRITELSLPWGDPTEARTRDALRRAILKRLGLREDDLVDFSVFKRSHDARRKDREIAFVYIVDVAVRDEAHVLAAHLDDRHVMPSPDTAFHPPPRSAGAVDDRPLVIGFGPCGLFTALVLAQQGYRPIVLERGRDVRRRTQDTWGLWRKRTLTPESNVQFGEGGAGLFSDGKLYSQIKDPRHLGRQVMREFVRAGAPPEIMWVNKPHIGTFRLTGVVARMREEIIALGGEIRFEQKVVDLLLEPGPAGAAGKGDSLQVRGVELEGGTVIASRHVVLALGHSSRDTFRMLHRRGVFMEAKPFAIGFRIEHPQSMIDRARLGRYAGHPAIGAADYKLVHHAANDRSVYSFCMCPGGTVVAATSEPQRVVTNGMSQYSRNERNANAGIVVGIDPERDFPGGPLAGIDLQERLESLAFEMGGGDYSAPAQLVGDFIAGRPSTALGEVEPSYKPGITLTDLAPLLPADCIAAMREALPAFGRQIRGFDRDDAVLTGIETRTSSPLRITRHADTLQSLNVRGLYPGGEGAGYAGGILSAGVDGIKLAEAVALEPPRPAEVANGYAAGLRMSFDELRGLKDKAQREARGLYLAEGEHLVLELGKALARRPALATARVLVSHEYAAAGLPAGFPKGLPVETLNARQMSQLSDTRTPQGVMAVVPILPAPPPVAGERAIYLHEVQDPGNLGTILRTLAWFGGSRCLLSPDSVDPYNPKVVRASMGAVFTLPFESDVTLDALRQRFTRSALMDTGGRPVASGGFSAIDCLMFGNEARGASPQMKALAGDAVFAIPGAATHRAVESLNLATAVAVCAYELSRNAAAP